MKSSKNLLQGNIRGIFYKYLVLSISATIMISGNYFIDTLCIGQKLGEEGLAALKSCVANNNSVICAWVFVWSWKRNKIFGIYGTE